MTSLDDTATATSPQNPRPRQELLPEVESYLAVFEQYLRTPDRDDHDPLIALKGVCLEEMVEAARARNDREQVGPRYQPECVRRTATSVAW